MPEVKVVIASYDDDPPAGGQGVYVRGLRTALVARGVSVRTVSGRGANAMPYPRVLRRAPLDFSLALNRNPSLLVQDSPDVVHAQGGPGGVLLLRRLPVPLVYTVHHTYAQAYPSWLSMRRGLARAENRAYHRAGMVIAVSPSTADAVRSLGVRRVEVVAPGIDVQRLSSSAEALRDPDLVLFVGRMEHEKGVIDAQQAMLVLASQRRGVRGVMVGTGRLAGAMRDGAARSGGTVEMRGEVSDDELRSLYARAAVVLMPSRYEGLGLVALEAMAAGAAVVAYDVTGLRDAVGDTGALVPAGDVPALVRAARALLDDPAGRADLVARARDRVTREHSWAAAAARVEEIYRAVVGA